MTRQNLDGTGSVETVADDQHQRDDDGRGMTEPREDLALRDDTTDVGDDQGAERDHVVPHPPPEEQSEERNEQGEEEYLISGHLESDARKILALDNSAVESRCWPWCADTVPAKKNGAIEHTKARRLWGCIDVAATNAAAPSDPTNP